MKPRVTGVPLVAEAGSRPSRPYQPREAVPATLELTVRYLKEELRTLADVIGRLTEELARLRAEHEELKSRYDAHDTHPPPA